MATPAGEPINEMKQKIIDLIVPSGGGGGGGGVALSASKRPEKVSEQLQVFRSGDLSSLTARDIQYFQGVKKLAERQKPKIVPGQVSVLETLQEETDSKRDTEGEQKVEFP
jgi:hypothetical protein